MGRVLPCLQRAANRIIR